MGMQPRRFLHVAAGLALVAALTVGCGDDPDDWVEITSPADGDAVTVPFEVTIEASVPLGPPSDDVHHVHIWFGDDQAVFLVGEANTVMVDHAPNGEHTMVVSLHRADHTPVGPQAEVPLVISGGADQPPPDDY